MEKQMSLDMHMRLYHSNHAADYVEICPDADGLNMVEIRQVSDDQQIGSRILVSLENVDDLIAGIRAVQAHMLASQ